MKKQTCLLSAPLSPRRRGGRRRARLARVALCLLAVLLCGCSARTKVEDDPATYARMADSYLEKAQETLRRGVDKTGDEALRQRLRDLEQLMGAAGADPDGTSTAPESDATGETDSASSNSAGKADGASAAVADSTSSADRAKADSASTDSASSSSPGARPQQQEPTYFQSLYRQLTTFPTEQRQLVNDIMEMVMEDDYQGIFSLEMPTDFSCYTFWNGYKCAVNCWEDCYTIEVRPENGSGVYYRLQRSSDDLGVASSETTTYWVAYCDCADWQWQGAFSQRIEQYDTVTYSDGASSNMVYIIVTDGNMENGRRDGDFVGEGTVTSIDENAPANNWQVSTRTETTYQDGVKVDQKQYEDGALLYAWDDADRQENADHYYGIDEAPYLKKDIYALEW